MLTSVHIKNFRSCKDVRLDNLGPMVALVGRNGAGKTTILKAIEWIAEGALSLTAFQQPFRGASSDLALGTSIEVELNSDGSRYRFMASIPPQERGIDELESLHIKSPEEDSWTLLFERVAERIVTNTRPDSLLINPDSAAIPSLMALLGRDDSLHPHLARVAAGLRNIRYYPGESTDTSGQANTPSDGPISQEIYDRWAASQSLDATRNSQLYSLIHASQDRPEIFSEIKQIMGVGGLGLLDDIRILSFTDESPPRTRRDRARRFFDVRFLPHGASFERSFSELSGGTRHALYLLLGLLYDQNSSMLIEQPEDGIHPGLLAKLIDVLRVNANPAQVILTSHSPVVLSTLQPSDVRLVDIEDGATSVRALTPAELERAKEYMQRDGSLAEFLELIQD